jgi:hypothetical protein
MILKGGTLQAFKNKKTIKRALQISTFLKGSGAQKNFGIR